MNQDGNTGFGGLGNRASEFHEHLGGDSPQIAFTSLINAKLYAAYQIVKLSSTQIQALHTTPIVLISAPSLTSFIVVDDISAYLNYISVAYTGTNHLEFRYTNGSGTKVTTDMGNTFLNSSAVAYDYAPGITTEFTPIVGAPIVVSVPVANPAAGNSSLSLLVHYRIINLT